MSAGPCKRPNLFAYCGPMPSHTASSVNSAASDSCSSARAGTSHSAIYRAMVLRTAFCASSACRRACSRSRVMSIIASYIFVGGDRRRGQGSAYTRFDLAVAPEVVSADRRRAIQIADRNGGVEVGNIGHDVEGPRRAVSVAGDQPGVVHHAEHAYIFHCFNRGEHGAVGLPYFTDFVARQVEKVLRDAAAKQHAQR